jgi:hypothetical protein
MRKLFLFVLLLTIGSTGVAQWREAPSEPISKSSVYANVGANGLGLSISYDYRLSKKRAGFGLSVGAGFVPTFFFGSILTVPFGATYLFGKAPHYVEAGMGYTYCHFNTGEERKIFGRDISTLNFGYVIPSIGYRFQQAEGGVTWKFVISPLIGSGYSLFFAGLGVGYTVK